MLWVNTQGGVLTNSFGPGPGFDMSSARVYLDDVDVTTNNPFGVVSGPYLLIVT